MLVHNKGMQVSMSTAMVAMMIAMVMVSMTTWINVQRMIPPVLMPISMVVLMTVMGMELVITKMRCRTTHPRQWIQISMDTVTIPTNVKGMTIQSISTLMGL